MTLIPIRRYVDSDNSCLFSSIAYLIDHEKFNETSSYKYRLMIAEYLINNNLDNVILDLPKNEYIEKIQKADEWGGAIELKLFSDIFEIQIGSIDVQTNRIDIYGEDKNYDKIIYLLYNGVHYDPLVMNFDSNSSNITDITKFNSSDKEIYIKFKTYVEKFNKIGDFVDLSTLKNFECETCTEQFQNENQALVHAQNTNHWQFKQI
jgi:ubiquitin thioesterase OTU1